MNASKSAKLHVWLSIVMLLLAVVATVSAQDSNQWVLTGTMNVGRADHTAATLSDGTVMLFGGFNKEPGASKKYLETTEIFSPQSGWTKWPSPSFPTTPKMKVKRASHTMTFLPPYNSNTSCNPSIPPTCRPRMVSGRYLIAGGVNGGGAMGSHEIFDPASRTFTKTEGGLEARYNHTATMIGSTGTGATVIVTGGRTAGDVYLDTVQAYSQATNTWTPLPHMLQARAEHTAIILGLGDINGDNVPDQGLVVVGGKGPDGVLDSVEVLVDLGAGPAWYPLASLQQARQGHIAIVRNDGRLMVAGGIKGGNPLQTTELFFPALGVWLSSRDTDPIEVPDPENPGQTILVDPPDKMHESHANAPVGLIWPSDVFSGYGFVVPGGQDALYNDVSYVMAEAYDDGANKWTKIGHLNAGRKGGHTISGFQWAQQVLVAGGYTDNNVTINTGDFFPVAVPGAPAAK